MKKELYRLLDGRIIKAKYDETDMCRISRKNLEAFIAEFNEAFRQAKTLEKIKENYALVRATYEQVSRLEEDGVTEIRIIDRKTGKEPTARVINNIAKKNGLMEMDIDQFAVCEDGSIILLDDCGNIAYCDSRRFKAEVKLSQR